MGMGNRMQTKMQTNGFFSILQITQPLGIASMAGVAQLVERWIVIPVVEGSNPFARPSPIVSSLSIALRGRSSIG